MAELNTGNGADNKGSKTRSKKLSTKIDMTPMVDLAFLLLTFFMLATSFIKPYVMDIEMPERNGDPPPVNGKRVLSIALGDKNKIYYYIGIENPQVKVTNYSKDGIRKIIHEHQSNIPNLIVLIKPMEKSKYKNVVDIFDEMAISSVPKYAMVDITPEELDFIKTSNL